MMDPARDVVPLPQRFVDPIQQRYELIRPLLHVDAGLPAEPVRALPASPEHVRTCFQRFQAQGMLGLIPQEGEEAPTGRTPRVPEVVRQEIARLKALYADLHYRELARILFATFGIPLHHQTVKVYWARSPRAAPQQ